MAEQKVEVDPVVRSRLGERTLADLRRNLWAIDCQSCGRAFGRFRTPVLGVRDHGDTATVALHHRRCLPSPWVDAPEVSLAGEPMLSWRASVALLPGDRLLFLVNPSCESAMLLPDGDGWRVGTLELFMRLGLVTDPLDRSEEALLVPGLNAALHPDRLSVHLRAPAGLPSYSWHCLTNPLSPVMPHLQSRDRLLVGVTTALRVGSGIRDYELLTAMADQQIAFGMAELLRAP